MKRPSRKFGLGPLRGVTLIELLVGLVVLSIGLTIAVPGFQGLVARNRITSQANEMLLAINLARSEAIRAGAGMSIRATSATLTDEFGGGWCIVPSSQADCSANVIQQFPALEGAATFNLVDDGGVSAIAFNSLGGLVNEVTWNIDLCLSGLDGRRIQVSPIGRPRSHKPNKPVPADPSDERGPSC